MAKRVSVKGKGAELFFGEYTPEPIPALAEHAHPDDPSPTPRAPIDGIDTDISKHASVPSDMQASKNASAHTRKPATSFGNTSTPEEPLTTTMLRAIWTDVLSQASITNSFRYTRTELEQLSDAIYDISKRHGIKLTKQDVARLGLNAVLWEYEARGAESLLTQFVLQKKRLRGGSV